MMTEMRRKCSSSRSVYKIESVPSLLRLEKTEAYTPNVVSIGPLHRKTPSLSQMEKVKTNYMRLLFQRARRPSMEAECLEAMLNLRETFSQCYPQVDVVDENFAKMMMIDGCFIIELVYRHYKEEDDTILQHLELSAVRRDLLLLENQIPLSALQDLFSLTVTFPDAESRPVLSLAEYVLWFFSDIIDLEYGLMSFGIASCSDLVRDAYHILHLLHICYHSRTLRLLHSPSQHRLHIWYRHEEHPGYQGTATHLNIAGAKLRKCKSSSSLFNVNFRTPSSLFFWKSGRLEIPRFNVNTFTETFFRNIIAFEQCFPSSIQSIFTSHAFLMDILIDSVEDVKLLENAGVICNRLGTSEPVVGIFNGICKNIDVSQHFHYNPLWIKMKHFCTPRRGQMETVKHNCAGNIWIRLSVIAAIILFILTLLQTAYSMLSYHHPRS